MTTEAETRETVWVTKYALSRGIVESELVRADPDGWAQVKWPGSLSGRLGIGRSAWAPTRQEAVKRAEAMRDRKIKSVEKQISRLRAMTFD